MHSRMQGKLVDTVIHISNVYRATPVLVILLGVLVALLVSLQ